LLFDLETTQKRRLTNTSSLVVTKVFAPTSVSARRRMKGMATCKILLLLGPTLWLCGAAAAAEPAPSSPRPAFGAKTTPRPLPQSFLDLVAGAESHVQDATASSSNTLADLASALEQQRQANRAAVAVKSESAKRSRKARAALASLKAAGKSGASTTTLLGTAKAEFQAAQDALDLLDGLAQQTGSTARYVSVHLHGDDEFRGLTDRVASAQHLIDGLAAPSEALPPSQRERGRVEVARLKKELTKVSVVLEKAKKVERELTTLVTEPAPLAEKSEIAKGAAEVEALSKRATPACDLRTVDWKNQRYSDASGEFSLKQGSGRAKWGEVSLSDVLFVDMDGNGSVEALVTIAEQLEEPDPGAGDTGNAMCNWEGIARTYVFTAGSACKPQLLGTFDQGTFATRKVAPASVIVDAPYFTMAATESRCFPSGLKRVTWRLNSGKLRSSSVTVR
jgi:hypothetical protein